MYFERASKMLAFGILKVLELGRIRNEFVQKVERQSQDLIFMQTSDSVPMGRTARVQAGAKSKRTAFESIDFSPNFGGLFLEFRYVPSPSGGWGDLPVVSDELDTLINSARKHIEPWLSAVFQAEHLNLLLGSGFTTAVGTIAGVGATGMAKVTFGTTYDLAIDTHAQAGATAMKRGAANIEDQFRSALALLDGLAVIDKGAEGILKDAIDVQMSGFLTSLLKTENGILTGIDATSKDSAQGTLQSVNGGVKSGHAAV